MKILITGHPRSGTGYAAKCLQDLGYDVPHEKLGNNGISSWLWATNCYDGARWGANYEDINPDITIMVVRNPIKVIESTLFSAPEAYDWMDKWLYKKEINCDISKAADYLWRWQKLALKNRSPDYIVKTEKFDYFCLNKFGKMPSSKLRGYNSRPHKRFNGREYALAIEQTHNSYRLWQEALSD